MVTPKEMELYSKLARLNNPNIIFATDIPEKYKQNITLRTILAGNLIHIYKTGNFVVTIQLLDQKIALLFNITLYNELFCKAIKENLQKKTENRIIKIMEDYM